MTDPNKNDWPEQQAENQSQHNFVEGRDPVETITCVIVAAAYLGLAKYCFGPLLLTKNWQLIFNVEIFSLFFALLAMVIAVRPYVSPSSLQISGYGIKYQGPYWPQRKTVNWQQVLKIYLSNEFIILLYRPDANRTRSWPLFIPTFYLGEREKIMQVVADYCPIEPIIMTNVSISTWIVLGIFFVLVLIWLLEMIITGG